MDNFSKLKTKFFQIGKKKEFPSQFYNEYNLQIPKKDSWFKRYFPDKILWILLICIAIKIVVFSYGIYLYNEGISRTTHAFFVEWGGVWWNLEGLCDFDGDYIMFRENWLNGEPLYSDAFNGRYLYPPLFYYLINVFARWTIFSAPIVMLICNILTGYFLFHLAKNLGANGKSAKIIMVLYLLSPLNLFYSDFIWQNTGVFTTFVVISMWQISEENYTWGMFWLGIAISTKHVAAFFMPIFLFGIVYKIYYKPREKWEHNWTFIEYIKSIPWTELIYYGFIPCIVFIICSFPYIFTIPEKFFGYLLGSNKPVNIEWLTKIFSNIVPVESNGVFVGYFPDLTLGEGNKPYKVNYRAVLDVAFAWLGKTLGIPTKYTVAFAILFHTQLLLYGFTLCIFLMYWRIIKKQIYFTDKEYYWMMFFVGSMACYCSIMFIELGIYKYYFLSIVPFFSLYGVIFPLKHDYWEKAGKYSLKEIIRQPKRIKYQFFGGGSIIHVIEQFAFQILLIYSNKWLAPAFIYLPIFLLGIFQIFILGNRKK